MGLPTSRELTFAANTDIPSSVLNAIQDAMIGMKKPSLWRYQVPGRGWIETNVTWDLTSPDGLGFVVTSGSGALAIPCLLPVVPGERITGISARILGTGGAQTVQCNLICRNAAANTVSQIGAIAAVNPAAAWTKFQDLTPTYTSQDEDSFFWGIVLPVNTTKIASLGLRLDRL